MSASEIRNIVEAALLAAGKSLTFSELSQLFEEQDRQEPAAIRAALGSLAEDYAGRPGDRTEGDRVGLAHSGAPRLCRDRGAAVAGAAAALFARAARDAGAD